MKNTHLILMVHGSRDPDWLSPFQKLSEELKEELGENMLSIACMQFISPTLEESVENLFKKGFYKIKVLPLFMAQGGHMKRDIPKQVEKVREKFPEITLELLPHIGKNPRFFKLLKEIIKDYYE